MRYFIQLSYRGTHYHGWQKQNNAPTVQAELEDKISMILKIPVEVTGCGRTDTGVHAHTYYVHMDSVLLLPPNFMYTLNAVLSEDISIQNIFTVQDSAHARFSAISRSYRYFIHYRKDPFLQDRSYYFRQATRPDISKMNEFCKKLLEIKDFSSFEKKGSDNTHSLCDVTKAEWVEAENSCYLEIQSNRFLRNMVRAVVGTSLMIGCHKREVSEIMQEIQNKKTIHLSMTAPAHGLHLWSIDYPENVWNP